MWINTRLQDGVHYILSVILPVGAVEVKHDWNIVLLRKAEQLQ